MIKQKEKLLEVTALKKHFKVDRKRYLKAVDGITFDIYKGEIFGLVGESGCGKSTLGYTILNLYDRSSGEVHFQGENIHEIKGKKNQKQITRQMQMIFQDPYASLNPRLTIKDIIAEGIDIHKLTNSKKGREDQVNELLEIVGLNKEHGNRYPHEFSGGQRQRIGIARALAVNPKFIVADEPISALDVSIQAQVINLMKKLQDQHDLTYLFISHDLAMVKHISDRIGVMYLGKMVELTSSEELYNDPLHPYTKSLLSAIPISDPRVERTRQRIVIEGEVPNPISPPKGCRFHTRCPFATEVCTDIEPEWQEYKKDHWVACHIYNEKYNQAFMTD